MSWVPISHVTTGQLVTASMWNDLVDDIVYLHDSWSWITASYSAGNYGTNGATVWTVDSGDRQVERYAIIGQTMFFQLWLTSTTLTSTANASALVRVMFGGQTALVSGGFGICAYFNGGVEGSGVWLATGTTITFAHDHFGSTFWTVSGTNNVHLRASGFFAL